MTTLHEWMAQQPSEDDGGPCQRARDWVEEHRHLTLTQMAEALADHPGPSWIWWLAQYLGAPLAHLARDAALRSLRIYAPAALERAGLHDYAALLRALPDDCNLTEAALLARAAPPPAPPPWEAELAARAAEAAEAEAGAAEAAEAAARAVAWEAAGVEAAAEEERRIQREGLVLLVLAALRARGIE